jgi:hypothetical protein
MRNGGDRYKFRRRSMPRILSVSVSTPISTSEVSVVVSLRVWLHSHRQWALTASGSLVQLEQSQSVEADALETWAQRVVRPVAVEGVKRTKRRAINVEGGT